MSGVFPGIVVVLPLQPAAASATAAAHVVSTLLNNSGLDLPCRANNPQQ
jgi:hypothetical protein